MKRKNHDALVKEALKRSDVKHEYDSLENEFKLLEAMLKARVSAGKTQAQVAKAMRTTTSVVGRLESAGGTKHSPTYRTLHRYAQAIGCELQIKFIPRHRKHKQAS